MYNHQVNIFAVHASHFSTPPGFTFMQLQTRAFGVTNITIVDSCLKAWLYMASCKMYCDIFSLLVIQDS